MQKSSVEYKKWWLFNKPSRLPKNPDRAYHKVWIGWGDFLGHSNPFPCVRRKFRSYTDARVWANGLGLTNRTMWFEYCKRPDFPPDVPKRPDVYYQHSLEWISWKIFLGYKVTDRIAAIGTTDHIILITRNPNTPRNVYTIGMTILGKDAILTQQRERGFAIVAAFYHDKNSEWLPKIQMHMSPYGEGTFIVNNIADILNVLSLNYISVSW
jgi:hypothetical protein